MFHSIKVVLFSGTVPGYTWGGKPANAIGSARCQMTNARVSGRKFFQIRCINWS